jgi:hypothetical protein
LAALAAMGSAQDITLASKGGKVFSELMKRAKEIEVPKITMKSRSKITVIVTVFVGEDTIQNGDSTNPAQLRPIATMYAES